MNILITGAGGFVGRNLTEYFKDKHYIFSATHSDLDLLDERSVQQYIAVNNIDLIIHCAAVGGSRVNNYDLGSTDIVSSNLRMFFNLEHCLTTGKHMIHLGSGAEYDRANWQHKISETYFDIHIPSDDYGYSKYLISKYINNCNNIICLRLFGLYGKYEDYRYKFISNAIIKNLLHMPITINQNVIFDYLYINDFVKIVELFINQSKPLYNIYNVSPNKSIDLITISNIINQLSDFKSDIIILNEGLNLEYTGDNSRLLYEFPNINFTDYETSIQELFIYYKSCLQSLDTATVKEDLYIKYCQSLQR